MFEHKCRATIDGDRGRNVRGAVTWTTPTTTTNARTTGSSDRMDGAATASGEADGMLEVLR
jgi:hypothetical protein